MDQLQTSQPNHQFPHIQMFQPVSDDPKMQNQMIHITHSSLQSDQGPITYQRAFTSQIIQNCNQPQIIQSHQQLIPVFKQQMLIPNYQQNYENYICQEEITVIDIQKVDNQDVKTEKPPEQHSKEKIKSIRKRCKTSEPSKWACNIRKQKHQRGEAYVNRRGKYVPERRVKNIKDCLQSCIYKCNHNISDSDRENIFKSFYSLTPNEKKHYLLSTTERNATRQSQLRFQEDTKRKYSFKYFFNVRGVRYTVCKKFYLGTLSISQKPVYNVHQMKSDMNIPKPDGRGLSLSSTQGVSNELKEHVRKHIMSFVTFENKPIIPSSNKKQYLEPSLTFKKMFLLYLNYCKENNIEAVKESMYRKIFKKEFNLDFKKVKYEVEVLCSRCKVGIKKKKRTDK